jgi:hypothetical protein
LTSELEILHHMTLEIIRARLQNQILWGTGLNSPEQVVSWFGAVQAQDYAAAKWAIGMRMTGATDAAIEKAFNEGRILRTHVLRPTWHFVAPGDIRWMLALTAPRVRMAMAYNDRRWGLETSMLKKSRTALEKALQGNRQLTRSDLGSVLEKADLPVDSLSLGQMLMHAELDGLICSGPRKGKQFTYALLEERAPGARILTRDEALAELARRYFQSHGPATAQDFAWWSGLTLTEARNGVEAVRSKFEHGSLDGNTYWFPADNLSENRIDKAWLLPNYDEYTVGYTDREAIFDAAHRGKLGSRASILAPSLLLEGHVVGLWKRTLEKNRVVVRLAPFAELSPSETQQVRRAAARYGEFLSLPAELVL